MKQLALWIENDLFIFSLMSQHAVIAGVFLLIKTTWGSNLSAIDNVCIKAAAVTVYEVLTDCLYDAVVVLLSVQHAVLDEDWDGSQDEGHEQVHVNEVPGTVELPV